MKFSKIKFPILNYLKSARAFSGFNETGFINPLMYVGESAVESIARHCDTVLDQLNIDFLSIPFYEKIRKPKLSSKLAHLFIEIKSCQGIVLYPPKISSQIRAVSYIIFEAEDNEPLVGTIQLYSLKGRVQVIHFQATKDRLDWKGITSENIGFDKSKPNNNVETWIQNHINLLLSILTFKQYAEIETKKIGGVKYPKRAKINEEKYLNESDHTVNILDSRWWTRTVRSEGFEVEGYLKLQHYGPGMSLRRLIYIDDFKKDGYNRRAKIEIKE